MSRSITSRLNLANVRTAVVLGVLVAALAAAAAGGAQSAAGNKPLQLKLSPDAGPVGTLVRAMVSRGGAVAWPQDPCAITAITFDGQSVAFVQVDPLDGVPEAQFAVPKVQPGAHEVEVQTSLGHAVKTWFTVTTPETSQPQEPSQGK